MQKFSYFFALDTYNLFILFLNTKYPSYKHVVEAM